jgi:hypothetical protein
MEIRQKFKEIVEKLKNEGSKASSDRNLSACYLFIRQISTCVSFAGQARIKAGDFT